jgi:hypothetical protein
MATVLKARREAAEAKVEAHPSIIELRKMHCDPAIAREFELLKAENKKLQQEASKLRETEVAHKFEVRSQVRCLLREKHSSTDLCSSVGSLH